MKDFAIVILNWNGKNLLKKFLPFLVEYSSDATIYLADNDSKDDSISYVKENFSTVKIIKNQENFGFAKGYNEALKQVSEKYLCLINSDIEVTENWLTPIKELFETNLEIGIIQPKILDYKNKTKFEYAGAAGGFIDKLGFPFCRGRIFDSLETDENQFNDETRIFWASGACFFIRNQVFKNLNGFDENFFAHQEEIDLCWRAYNQNIQVYYCGKSTVYHVGGATLDASNPKKTFLNYRNSLLMLYKNLPKKRRFCIIFKRLCYDGISGVRLMLQLKPLHCFAIVRSHFAFYGMISKYKQLDNSNNKSDYFYTNDIVKSYFVKKKKTFNEIKKIR
ncbi:glycosyltransferase family 2 protein [Flavobacterium sp. I3-2]|uniref:glycosyltransferase family 2 protein n=1 Tax=Flavobacterium sp. I3-2 TaxID=2748319 RepID=UPI0015AA130F|nr:glycosyltransferase family 2 protein [Flavobacterium sp. I3-2]